MRIIKTKHKTRQHNWIGIRWLTYVREISIGLGKSSIVITYGWIPRDIKKILEELEENIMSDLKERAQAAYVAFSSFANSDRMNSNLVGEAMIHDHPLLQAYTLGIMLDCIKAMAENDHVTPQNEAAVKLCKEIQEFIGEYPQYL